jgi:hypothetical protein
MRHRRHPYRRRRRRRRHHHHHRQNTTFLAIALEYFTRLVYSTGN